MLLAGCGGGDPGEELAPPTSLARPDGADGRDDDGERMALTSPAFEEGAEIPVRFTCDGESAVPPLRWEHVPERATELAVTVVDPDAPSGQFVHWVVTGIPVGAGGIPAGGPLPEGAVAAESDAGTRGWAGPCPPEGETHTYVFTLYALAEPAELEGSPGDDVAAVQAASSARAELTASYGR